MDVPRLLEAASLLVPEATATEDDLTVHDVWDHLVRDEWETALNVLEELRGRPEPPTTFWEALADAAERLRMPRSAAWCHWRRLELRDGVIRADLTLRSAAESRRKTPIFSGTHAFRPMWNIGHRSPAGGMAVNIASLWFEERLFLEPGGRARVRLHPLDPAQWTHVVPGQRIDMHEGMPVSGTAVVLEVRRPDSGPSCSGLS
ncbi:hypothetical protein [Streptomyces sp. UNOC14_S4]|uniref:hypothetical protein n=1 Tax=Streptomyces sp. UNOC14_S4 TaxID=2872340 RepID=UPI001E3F0EED|nr:hypothetical protein [Streptomyces sp. UNOC14_S4]MCC3771594.1 hypothetical protein [Streptomyces sp. UNOC14_S4]